MSKVDFENSLRLADRSTFARFYTLNENKLVQRFERFDSFVERDENNEFITVSDDEVRISRDVYIATEYVKIRFMKFSRDAFEDCSNESEVVALAEQLADNLFRKLLSAFSRFLAEEKKLSALKRAAFFAAKRMSVEDED